MLRFILVNAAHVVIKYSRKMKNRYLSLVRRPGRNRAIVAIVRILIETIYTMLKKGEDFVDQIDTLAERKMKSMKERAKNPSGIKDVEEVITYISEERIKGPPKELFFHRSTKVSENRLVMNGNQLTSFAESNFFFTSSINFEKFLRVFSKFSAAKVPSSLIILYD